MPRIGVLGAGFVGLTSSACLAELGNEVICCDIDEEKVEQLRQGRVELFEDRLEKLVLRNQETGRLQFSNRNQDALTGVEAVFVCLPTPLGTSGGADVSAIWDCLDAISCTLSPGSVVVMKSTIPIGLGVEIAEVLDRSSLNYVSNPEFLREGSAVADFLSPSRIVLGSNDRSVAEKVLSYFGRVECPVVFTDISSAETVKYASNAFLAMKVSFANQLSVLCAKTDSNMQDVVCGMESDDRIGRGNLTPGPGWGGSCFPKDTRALVAISRSLGHRFSMVEETIEANERHQQLISERILCSTELTNPTVGILGISFKANTNDYRESPSIRIAHQLIAAGARVSMFDPVISGEIRISDQFTLHASISPIDACEGADVVVVLTEWKEFSKLDPFSVASVVSSRRVMDLRNILNRSDWKRAGFTFVEFAK